MQRIAILGSTGSIGRNTLKVIRQFAGYFKVLALTTNSNIDILRRQVEEFRPEFACVRDEKKARKLQAKLKTKTNVLCGEDGLEKIAQDKRISRILVAISGSGALAPLLKAIENGKDIALANKEALVMAGPIIMRRAAIKKVKIIPVDSEQSAIWQCLDKQDKAKLKNIYLTASGGPFGKINKKELKGISVARVLKHPKWKMGKKVSVDSATLMNKGLELLEAMYLFNVEPQRIKILIHPQAVIHSMVEFIDGVIMAQLSVTDMRIPIQYALSYPERLGNVLAGIDFFKSGDLSFKKPDFGKFPCLGLAYSAARQAGTAPSVLNAADEVSVEEFLRERLDFLAIPKVIEGVLSRHHNKINPDLNDILQADAWAREEAYRIIDRLS